jgi:septal ring factor EnvC (AmiA/AmiB activator)
MKNVLFNFNYFKDIKNKFIKEISKEISDRVVNNITEGICKDIEESLFGNSGESDINFELLDQIKDKDLEIKKLESSIADVKNKLFEKEKKIQQLEKLREGCE